MRNLDERMRRRLRALAESEESPLGPIERQRVLMRVRERPEAPRGTWLGVAAAAAAMALALVWWAQPASIAPSPASSPEPRRLARSSTASTTDVDEPRAPVARVGGPACATAPIPELREARWRGGRRALDLDGRARFVLFAGAEAEIAHDTCTTVLTMASGRVLVHAEELLGGELVVRTEAGEVVVHGTLFDVRVDGRRRLAVAVAEGEVGVRHDGGERRVPAGSVLEREGVEETVRALAGSEVRTMLSTLRHPAAARANRAAEEVPRVPRGEVVGGVPMVHEPDWSRREGVH